MREYLLAGPVESPTFKDVAETIIHAIDIRENSWNKNTKEYRFSIAEASSLATKRKYPEGHFALDELVYLLLMCCWNDGQGWAMHVLGPAKGERE